MVHALRDAWRVLGPDGILIDLRPLSGVFSIDAVAGSDSVTIAEVDSTEGADLDRAADSSIGALADEGRLVLRHRAEFDLHFYWNTTAEMAEYMATGRREKRVTPSYAEIGTALQATSRRAGVAARLRSTRRMSLGSYAKGAGR